MPHNYTPEQVRRIVIAHGYDPSQYTIDSEGQNLVPVASASPEPTVSDSNAFLTTPAPALPSEPQPSQPPQSFDTPLGTAAKSFAQEALPMLGGGLAATAAGAGLVGAGLTSTGAGALVGLPLMGGAALLGSYLTRKAQQAIEPQSWQESVAASQATNPKSALAGNLLAMPLGGMSASPTGLLRAGRALPKILTGMSATPQELSSLINVGAGAGLGAGGSILEPIIRGEQFDPKTILENAAIGALFNRQNALGGRMAGMFGMPTGHPMDIGEQAIATLAQFPPAPPEIPPEWQGIGGYIPKEKYIKEKIPAPIKSAKESAQAIKEALKAEKEAQPLPPVWEKWKGSKPVPEPLQPEAIPTFEEEGGLNLDVIRQRNQAMEDQIAQAEQLKTKQLKAIAERQNKQQKLYEESVQRREDLIRMQEEEQQRLTAERQAQESQMLEQRRQETSGAKVGEVSTEELGKMRAEQTQARMLGKPEEFYSKPKPAPTPFQTEIGERIKEEAFPGKVTPAYAKVMQDFNEAWRGIKTKYEKVVTPEGTEALGKAVPKEGTIILSPERFTADTPIHEAQGHIMLERMLNSKRARDVKFSNDFLNIVKKQPEFAEWSSKTGGDAEEWIATNSGYEFLRRSLRMDAEGPMKEWWKDVSSYWKTRFGKHATEADYRRILNYEYMYGKPESKALGVNAPARFADTRTPEEKSVDAAAYKDLTKQAMEYTRKGEFPPQELQQKIEDLKNKQGGEKYQDQSVLSELEKRGFTPSKDATNRRLGWMNYSTPEGGKASVQVDPDRINLVGMFVDEKQQGKGIGSNIIKQLKEVSDTTGKPIYLLPAADTTELQPRLEAFYSRHGFEPTGDENGQWKYEPTKKSIVIFDPKEGIGAFPKNQDIDYFGFVKKMKPHEYLSLASKQEMEPTAPGIEKAIREGKSIGNPSLFVEWNDTTKSWKVSSHEGRNRSMAIHKIDPNTDIPVHIFPEGGLRARDITEEMRNAPIIPEKHAVEYKPQDIRYSKHSILPTFARPEIEKVRALEHPDAPVLADGMVNFYNKRDEYSGKLTNDVIGKLLSFIPKTHLIQRFMQNTPEMERVVKRRMDLQDYGKSNITLTPNEQKIDAVVQESLDKSLAAKNSFPSLVKKSIGDPNYMPMIPSRRALDILLNKQGSPEARKFIGDWYNYYYNVLGQTKIKAQDDLKVFMAGYEKRESNLAEQFGPIDKAAGLGIPPSWRETNLVDIMGRFNNRYGRRLAYEAAFNNDPKVMEALNNPESGLSRNEFVKNVVADIQGHRENEEAKRTAISGIVRAAMLGPLTGTKDFVSNPFLGMQHQDLLQSIISPLKAWSNINQNLKESFSAGVNRHNLAGLEMDDKQLMTNMARRMRDIINVAQGRNWLEQMTRATAWGQGKYIAADNIWAAHKGHLSSQQEKFLNDMGPKNWRDYVAKGELPEDALRETAANYVRSVQGTYDYRGLPSVAQKGTFAPYLMLARWNIEKLNNFDKFVIQPAKQGNWRPLLMSTIGMLVGGEAVNQVVELITKRKERTPKFAELAAIAEEPEGRLGEAILYKAAGLASLSGYGGLSGDLFKFGMDKWFHNRAQTYSNPLVAGLDTFGNNVWDFIEAAREGDLDLSLNALSAILDDYFQAERIFLAQAIPDKQRDIEKQNDLRDFKLFKSMTGAPVTEPTKDVPNPFLKTEERKYKQTGDLGEAIDLLPSLLTKAFDKANGNPERLRAELRALKQNNYQIMPSPEEVPIQFSDYLAYLSKSQGSEVASDRLSKFLVQREMNKVKGEMIPSL